MWSEDSLHQLEVWRVQSFASFWVVLPARCASSISPRFLYRRHAFCFLPLAAILESLLECFMQKYQLDISYPQDMKYVLESENLLRLY
jgi:hypothetical protein